MRVLQNMGIRLLGLLGYSSAVAAAFWAVAGIAVQFDDTAKSSAKFGMVILVALFGLPAFTMLRKRRQMLSQQKTFDRLLGTMATHDRITPSRLADTLEISESEAEQQLLELAAARHINLLYHAGSRSYIKRDAAPGGSRTVSSCSGCSGRFEERLLMNGESSACPYCGASL